jgi:hypothetical protein
MFAQRRTRPASRSSRSAAAAKRRPRSKPPLDAAGLLLELDMAALVKESEASLRQDRDDGGRRGVRRWWRRLFGTRYANRTA